MDIGSYYSDSQFITRTLDWHPAVLLREGIAGTLAYFDANRLHYWKPSAASAVA